MDNAKTSVEFNITRDLIHEIRSISAKIDELSRNLDKAVNAKDYPAIEKLATSIRAFNYLIDCRMELYEYHLNPGGYNSFTVQPVSIYREIEKIYKSINDGWEQNFRKVNLKGKSLKWYELKKFVSIGLFILLENAWKYSPKNYSIDINFSESTDKLAVSICNFGPYVYDDEKGKLCCREYRGRNACKMAGVRGSGLGLNIASRIFKDCGVDFSISPSSKKSTFNGVEMAKFYANLTFRNPVD